MSRTPDMHSRLALVTGASSGIGKAIADALYEQNARIINADIREPHTELTGKTNRYFFFRTDIASGEEMQQLFRRVSTEVGHPDILVCNAGKGVHERLSEGDPEKWFEVISTNLMGTLRVLRAFLPGMLQKGRGDIVMISSVAAHNAYTYGGIYSATKAALDMVAQTLRLELAEKVRVTVIAPGVVDTSFFENMNGGGLSVEGIGQGALLPAEVADAVLYALSRPFEQVINNITLRPVKQIM